MAFTSTPLDGSGTPIPMASAVPDGTNTPLALEGGPAVSTGGNSLTPVSTYVKDGNNLVEGLTTDAAVTGDTTGTLSAKLRGLNKILADVWDSTNHHVKVDGSGVTQPIQQSDLTTSGTLSAAQPTIGTPVSNATVVLSVGQGQSSWKAGLVAGGGGFTSGTTIVADQQVDGNWIATSFKVAGSTTASTVQSVVGPGPIIIAGDCASAAQIRVRCSVLNSTETIVVTMRAGAGQGSVGIIGEVASNVNQLNGTAISTNTGVVDAGTQRMTLATDIKVPTKAASGDFVDGAIVSLGANADAAVTGDTAGTLSAKLRGLTKMIFDMWDSTNHWLQVKVMNGNANGQNTMVNSQSIAIASDQSAVKVKPDNLEVAGVAAGSVTSTSTPIIASFDASAYKSWSFQMSGTWTMTLQVQFSDDNVAFQAGFLQTVTSGTLASSITTNNLFNGPVLGRYMRIIPSAWTSNASGVGTLEMSTAPWTSVSTFANQQGTWTVMPGNTQNTTPWLFAGPTSNSTAAANGGTGKAIKASTGALWSIVVTATGTAATNIYDNASASSGTVLLAIPANAAVGTIYSFPGGAPAANGIFADQVANAPGITAYIR